MYMYACAITGHRPNRFKFKYNEDDSRCKRLKKCLKEQFIELCSSQIGQYHQFIFPTAKSKFLATFQCPVGQAGFNSFHQRFTVFHLIHQIYTCLIQRNRVSGRKNANVVNQRSGRVGLTVTVHRKIVHYVDI